MVIIDKPYRHERIPGLSGIILKRVHDRSFRMLNLVNPPFNGDQRQKILMLIEGWEADRLYDAAPFKDLLETYPGPQDFQNLYTFQLALNLKVRDDKEMNAWANNLIEIAKKELFPPKRNPFTVRF